MLNIQFIYLQDKGYNKFLHLITCNKCKKSKDICPHIRSYILDKHQIQISNHPDVIIAFYEGGPYVSQDQKLLNLLSKSIPVIVCERLDSASSHLLSTHDKAHKPNPIHPHLDKLLGVFKNYTLKPKTLHNEPTILSRYHYTLLRELYPQFPDTHAITPKNTLSSEILNKIRTVPWDSGSSFLSDKYIGLSSSNKTLDVFCAVSIKFGSYYTIHRQSCINALSSLNPNIKKETKQLPHNQYIQKLRESKICVSPYGLGEFSYRDYEAIYCGSLLIKPDMSHVETYPDIYEANKTYIPCKIDFSDLNEIIERVLNNYGDYAHIKDEALKRLRNKTKFDVLDLFCDNIKDLYEKRVR